MLCIPVWVFEFGSPQNNVVNSIDDSNEPFLYRGEDCMDVFVKKMIEVKDKIMDKMKENKDIIMRADDWRDSKTATK